MHIENDDIFVALLPLGLQPATEMDNSLHDETLFAKV